VEKWMELRPQPSPLTSHFIFRGRRRSCRTSFLHFTETVKVLLLTVLRLQRGEVGIFVVTTHLALQLSFGLASELPVWLSPASTTESLFTYQKRFVKSALSSIQKTCTAGFRSVVDCFASSLAFAGDLLIELLLRWTFLVCIIQTSINHGSLCDKASPEGMILNMLVY
jgi:hypothetical protein